MIQPTRQIALVLGRQFTMAGRQFVESVRQTPEGKIAVVMLVVSPFVVSNVLAESSERAERASFDIARTTLLVTHIALACAMSMGVVARTARSLVLERAGEPLSLYPDGRRGLAGAHLVGTIAHSGVLALLLYHLFFASLIIRASTRPPMVTLSVHLLLHAVMLATIGALSYRVTVTALERRPTIAWSLHVAAGVGAIVTFLSMIRSPSIIETLSPQVLSSLASASAGLAPLYPPLGAILPVKPTTLAAGVVSAGAASVLAALAGAPLVRTPSPLLLGDLSSRTKRRIRSVFSPPPGPRRLPAGIRLFFLKDLWLPVVRSPRDFFIKQSVLLGLAVSGPAVLWQLKREGRVDDLVAEATLLSCTLALPAIPAYVSGLPCLGKEGHQWAFIRPFVRPAALWRYKVLPVMAAVTLYGVSYGAILGFTAQALSLGSSPLSASLAGASAGIAASANAVALGFLSPDFGARSSRAPGATRVAKRLFELFVCYGIGSIVVVRIVTRRAVFPEGFFTSALIAVGCVSLLQAAGVTWLALRRLHLREG